MRLLCCCLPVGVLPNTASSSRLDAVLEHQGDELHVGPLMTGCLSVSGLLHAISHQLEQHM